MTDACAAAASNVVLILLELQITLEILALTNSLCEFALISSAICHVIAYDFSKCVPHNHWKATLMPTQESFLDSAYLKDSLNGLYQHVLHEFIRNSFVGCNF